MKTTLDLPDHLLLQAKQRALQENRTLRDLVADYIRQGLHGTTPAVVPADHSSLRVDAKGFPLFRRRDASSPAPALTLEQALQLDQDALSREDRLRAGLPG